MAEGHRFGSSSQGRDLMMNTHKRNSPIPFALTSNGRLVDVSSVESGLIEEGACPKCGGKLVAKKGVLRAHHFAHYASTNCSGALESALHKAAKQVLLDALRDGSPFYAPAFSGLVGQGRGRYPAQNISMTHVECEATVFLPGEHRRPDAVVTWEGKKLAVEICVTNPVDDEGHHFMNALAWTVLRSTWASWRISSRMGKVFRSRKCVTRFCGTLIPANGFADQNGFTRC